MLNERNETCLFREEMSLDCRGCKFDLLCTYRHVKDPDDMMCYLISYEPAEGTFIVEIEPEKLYHDARAFNKMSKKAAIWSANSEHGLKIRGSKEVYIIRNKYEPIVEVLIYWSKQWQEVRK